MLWRPESFPRCKQQAKLIGQSVGTLDDGPKPGSREHDYANRREAEAALWWKSLIMIAYTTGLRVNELMNLTWQDVDFEQDLIQVISKPNVVDLHGWEPKSKKSRRVTIPKMAVDLLTELHQSASERNPYIFLSEARLQHIKDAKDRGAWREDGAVLNNLTRGWQRLVKKAGIAHATLHDLRRSAITNWARTSPIHVVQELAGHSSIETTRRYYLSITENDLEVARNPGRCRNVADRSPCGILYVQGRRQNSA